MHSVCRLVAVACSVIAMLFTTLVVTSAPASAGYTTCGVHTHTSYGTTSYGATTKTVRIHYLNCSMYSSTRLRPDIANMRDKECKTIYPGGTAYWSFSDTYYGNGAGGPYFRGLYNC